MITDTTDGSGDYSVPDLAPNSYTVVATASGFQTVFQGAIVTAGGITTVDFALDPNPGTIEGNVIGACIGNSLPGTQMTVFDGSIPIAFALTDAGGNYTIPGLPNGIFTVMAEKTPL